MKSGYYTPHRIWADRRLAMLSMEHWHVFSRCFALSDAWGRLPIEPEDMSADVWVDGDRLRVILNDLCGKSLLHRYVIDGDVYAVIDRFDHDAKTDYLKKRPAPEYPDPPPEVFKAAKCSAICRADKGGQGRTTADMSVHVRTCADSDAHARTCTPVVPSRTETKTKSESEQASAPESESGAGAPPPFGSASLQVSDEPFKSEGRCWTCSQRGTIEHTDGRLWCGPCLSDLKRMRADLGQSEHLASLIAADGLEPAKVDAPSKLPGGGTTVQLAGDAAGTAVPSAGKPSVTPAAQGLSKLPPVWIAVAPEDSELAALCQEVWEHAQDIRSDRPMFNLGAWGVNALQSAMWVSCRDCVESTTKAAKLALADSKFGIGRGCGGADAWERVYRPIYVGKQKRDLARMAREEAVA